MKSIHPVNEHPGIAQKHRDMEIPFFSAARNALFNAGIASSVEVRRLS
jgi:hypothetical protein